MIAMLSRSALGAEGEDNFGPALPEKVHDLADEPVLIDIAKTAVRVTGGRERADPQHAGGSCELRAPQCPQLGTRRHGEARALSGIPVGRAKQIDVLAAQSQLRQGSTHRERLVVRVGEDAGEPMHVSRGPLLSCAGY